MREQNRKAAAVAAVLVSSRERLNGEGRAELRESNEGGGRRSRWCFAGWFFGKSSHCKAKPQMTQPLPSTNQSY